MRVFVTGASGLIGTALVAALISHGHRVTRLVRRPPRGADEIAWDPARGVAERGALEGFDAGVHLAGESIASGRWTPARKVRLRSSRVEGTRSLAGSLANLERPPSVLVSASAMGIYGDRGDERLDEESPIGSGFLPELARDWERAATPARERGIRVVHPRLGLVLSREGGLLARLLPIFRLGLGGPIGRGRRWWSWVAIDDVVAILERMLADPALSGPVNVVAPVPVTNAEFTRTLARVLGRPAFLPVPPPALRLLWGEMADQALLTGQRMEPALLQQAGHRFRHETLESALRSLLGTRPDPSRSLTGVSRPG